MSETRMPPRFDPTQFQTEIDGKAYALTELSHADLLQVACECMQALEMLDELQEHGRTVLQKWRDGRIEPDPA